MSALILPKRYHPDFRVPNRKPVGPVEIDRSNRFGKKAAFITGSQGSLVCAEGSRTNLSWRTKHSTQHVGSKAGDLYLYADHGGSNDDTLITTDSLPSIATSGRYAKQTFYFYYTPEAAGNNNQRLCYYIGNYCLGFYINLNFGGSSYFGYWANSGFKYYYALSSAAVSYDKPNFIAVSIDGENKLLSICVNGYDSSDATATTGTQSWLGQGGSADAPMRIGWSEFDNYYNAKGRVHSAGLIHDYFDEPALKELSKSVYQGLNPANPITYFIPSAGGGAVAQQIDLQWGVRQLINQSANLHWGVLNTVSQSSSLQWALLNTVSNNTDLRWGLLSLVNQTSDLRWDILAALGVVGQSVDIQWSMLQKAAQNTDLRWRILSLVFNDTDLRWGLINNVSQQADLRYALLANAAQTIDLRWDTLSSLASVGNSVDLRWDILAYVSQSLDAQWPTLELVSTRADLQWQIAVLVSKDADLQWALKQSAGQAVDIRWDVIATTSQSIDLRWSIISDNQFPDITGIITLKSSTAIINIESRTPIITIQ